MLYRQPDGLTTGAPSFIDELMATNPATSSAEPTGRSIASSLPNTSLFERLGGHPGIVKLIKPFYADIRQHAVVGPIFAAHIHDWPAHLANIADFWALQTGGISRYRGGFGTAHRSLGIGAEHFQHWLSLWEFNNARQLDPVEAAEMNALARQLTERLLSVTRRSRLPATRPPSPSRSRTPEV